MSGRGGRPAGKNVVFPHIVYRGSDASADWNIDENGLANLVNEVLTQH